MKKYVYATGTAILALAMSGLPTALAHAEDNGGGGDGNAVQVTDVQVQTQQAGESAREQQKQNAEVSREQQKQQLEQEKGQLEASSSDQIRGEEGNEQEINLELEDDSNPATSFEDLQRKIEVRKQELEQEAASSTPENQDIVENANPVRLAVHALLASKDLIGGIGPQVSQIAKEMNDSVATTTNAEAKIQSRGFFVRLLFGGDSEAASVIAQEVAQNQQRIQELTALLDQANVPVDVQTTLKAQITALEDAQTRLQDLAQKEQGQWGLFSWRF